MYSRVLSATAVALAASRLASAQTSTNCNPMEKTCPDDPAFGDEVVEVNFSNGHDDVFYEFDGTKIEYNEKGAVFEIGKYTDAPTIGSHKFLLFGKVDVEVESSPGQGIITSFVLQSDNLDEIDWEWLGKDAEKTKVQSNYFGKGDTTTYDRGGTHTAPDGSDLQTTVHTYTVDWTKESLKWIIDGVTVRELKYADAQGGSRYPQTPMQIRLGTWVAGRPDAPDGTVEWAGGVADFSGGKSYKAYYKSIKVTDYANGVKGATKYNWSEGSDGSYESINIITTGGDDETTTSKTKTATSTSKPTGTSSSKDATKTDDSSSKSDGTTLSKTASSTATASASATPSADSSSSATEGSDTPSETGSGTGSSTSPTATASNTPVPQGAGFKAGISTLLMGAGLCVALFAL